MHLRELEATILASIGVNRHVRPLRLFRKSNVKEPPSTICNDRSLQVRVSWDSTTTLWDYTPSIMKRRLKNVSRSSLVGGATKNDGKFEESGAPCPQPRKQRRSLTETATGASEKLRPSPVQEMIWIPMHLKEPDYHFGRHRRGGPFFTFFHSCSNLWGLLNKSELNLR
jgi:hypothetical protein